MNKFNVTINLNLNNIESFTQGLKGTLWYLSVIGLMQHRRNYLVDAILSFPRTIQLPVKYIPFGKSISSEILPMANRIMILAGLGWSFNPWPKGKAVDQSPRKGYSPRLWGSRASAWPTPTACGRLNRLPVRMKGTWSLLILIKRKWR